MYLLTSGLLRCMVLDRSNCGIGMQVRCALEQVFHFVLPLVFSSEKPLDEMSAETRTSSSQMDPARGRSQF